MCTILLENKNKQKKSPQDPRHNIVQYILKIYGYPETYEEQNVYSKNIAN